MKTEQALSGTSAATYKVMEPQYKETQLSINGILIVRHKGKCSASKLKKLNGTHVLIFFDYNEPLQASVSRSPKVSC